ncbi:aminopeptidase N [Dendroctonus ponderosae]|uniref:aminopeptidase N n=1 Tax=Dendroctonus ponderosae TaxID=77166 RepID=UPI00203524C5|nr:aminopeptidase N [Dendroctonus ponderosae]XP_048524082.1 aminopeptidase N [Dendroctonus ponderosae]XP_048524083.1 aminopeptidase N [Dendroctonus ponderosae]XP_048524084.1 aminopeptidase N [Dendroctonus ponderosae]
MTHENHENLSMMDAVTTKYGKTTFVTVSKTLAIILLFIFFICLVATGLLVYSFTSTCPKNETLVADITSSEKSEISLCDNLGLSEGISKVNSLQGDFEEFETTTPVIVERPTPKPSTVKDLGLRLSKDMVPDSYKVHLIPFIQEDNFTFHGEEIILVNVSEASTNVTLHSVGLSIVAVNVMNINNESISVKDVRSLERKQFIVIDLDGVVEAGQQYQIYIKFKGVLNDMLQGFYRSSYVEQNVTKWIAATQFQATDARRAFPCFDEPAFKAKFQINIARLKNMTAISNMPKIDTTPNVKDLPDYVWDQFEESLPMSTYLVAFVVSDFQNISKGSFSVWARPSALSQARFALEIAPLIFKYYEKFFGIEYPLPKVDLVAIPDFSAGAMENWGLITCREPLLLYEEGISSTVSKQRIAHVIAHEIAHQWFGNLVTPEWWDDLWLNEGFATYAEFLGAHAVNPKWKNMDLLVNELHESLVLDALKSSHPISVEVNDPDEVNDIFDRISYSKSACIIRMIKDFVGDKVFVSGLQKYLKNRMYKNAVQDDLWQSLTEETLVSKMLPENTTIKEIMDTWTLQTGYPVLTATIDVNGDLTIIQKRYLLNRDTNETDQSLWWVPVTVLDSADTRHHAWMEKERQIILKGILPRDTSWFLVNVHQTGYYRVNYAEENWKSLTNQLQGNGHRLINPRNRAQMIDDALNLAFAGYLNYDVALNLTLYLPNEREYVPWKAALTNFQFLHNMFARSGHFDKFKVYVISLLKDFYLELTFKESDTDEPTRVLTRMEIVEYACRLGLKDCVLQAVQYFQNWRNSANPDKDNLINLNVRQTVYCTAIGDGGQEEWDFAWNRYLNANVATDKEIILTALACSKEIWILSRYLEWSITENSGIRKHDTARVFALISENPVGHDLVYRFVKTNWQRIRKYLGPSSAALSSIIKSATEKFNTEEEVDDFKSFFERHRDQFGIAMRSAQQSIEQGEANTRWMKNNFASVRKWLETAKLI